MKTPAFAQLFSEKCPVIAMIHVQALPGTPQHTMSMDAIVAQAVAEARLLTDAGVQAIMLENMHDIPYLNRNVGPEIVASLTRVAQAVRSVTSVPLGIQVLAGANREALAIAHAADFQFIRGEGFVFGHLADEGLIESDAGALLRYRKQIGAEQIRIFSDVKKKHSSHALSQDISLMDTVAAAEFFLSDGVIITGSHTGAPVNTEDLSQVYARARGPVLVGSGVTPHGLAELWGHADAVIVGSYFKVDGQWQNPPDPTRVSTLVAAREALLS